MYKIVGRWEPKGEINRVKVMDGLVPILQELGTKIGVRSIHDTSLRDPEANTSLLKNMGNGTGRGWHRDSTDRNCRIVLLLWASAWPTWLRLNTRPKKILVPPRYSIALVDNDTHEHRMPVYPHKYPRWFAVSRIDVPRPDESCKAKFEVGWYLG